METFLVVAGLFLLLALVGILLLVLLAWAVYAIGNEEGWGP